MQTKIREAHPMAGQTVKLNKPFKDHIGNTHEELRIEDWWQNVSGGSWMNASGNPACLNYAVRSGFAGLPTDNEVVYGKTGKFGNLFHVSEFK